MAETCHYQHKEIGALDIQIYPARKPGEHTVVDFTLTARAGFKLYRCEDGSNCRSNLGQQYQWYSGHEFCEGEQLKWQTIAPPTQECQQTVGPWQIYGTVLAKPTNWEIKAITLATPPKLSIKEDVQQQGLGCLIRVWLCNHTPEPCRVLLTAEWKPHGETGKAPVCCGYGQLWVDIPACPKMQQCGESQPILYNTEQCGQLSLAVKWQDDTLLTRQIEVTVPEEPANMAPQPLPLQPNRNVAVVVENIRNGHTIALKNGYYPVKADDDLRVTINPRFKKNKKNGEYVGDVKKVTLKHPNLVVASTGQSNDKTFCYDVKVLSSSPLTMKMPVLYTVEYEDGEERAHILPFKLCASMWWLCLIGLLFILPNLLDVLFDAYDFGLPKAAVFSIGAFFCMLLPLLYDRLQSR